MRNAEKLLFTFIKSNELGKLATSVFPVDLDETAKEEIFFLCSRSLPIIWLANSDEETKVRRPLFMLLIRC